MKREQPIKSGGLMIGSRSALLLRCAKRREDSPRSLKRRLLVMVLRELAALITAQRERWI